MNTCKKLTYATLIILIYFSLSLFSINTDVEEKKILETVNMFLRVLETGDKVLAKEILVSEGSNFSVREDGESFKVRFTDYKTLIEDLPKSKGKYREVINDPKILLHGNIAVLWAKYDFFINGTFSHCGVDSFSLIKSEGKWKIASIIYTVEKKGCK